MVHPNFIRKFFLGKSLRFSQILYSVCHIHSHDSFYYSSALHVHIRSSDSLSLSPHHCAFFPSFRVSPLQFTTVVLITRSKWQGCQTYIGIKILNEPISYICILFTYHILSSNIYLCTLMCLHEIFLCLNVFFFYQIFVILIMPTHIFYF